MPDTNQIISGRAIMLDAGIAGLAAAGVASNYFKEVIVIERDKLPAQPQLLRWYKASEIIRKTIV